MRLKKILQDIPVEVYRGSKEIEITGITSHSKSVAPGYLFIAKGGKVDYLDEAVESGAVALLSDMGNPFLKGVTQLVHPDVAAIEGRLAAAFYEHPSKELLMVGITGTSGKTSTSYLVKHLLDHLFLPCGLIGTIEYSLGTVRYPASLTTPDVVTNHKLLREMLRCGCRSAVMEVSSHGLVQGRCRDIDFDIALFTNLSHEHLDYHVSMEEYAKAKALLFKGLSKGKRAVVCADSPWTPLIIKETEAKILTFGFAKEADLRAENVALSSSGSTFDVFFGKEKESFTSPLLGRYNVSNVLGALAVAVSEGVPLSALREALATFPGVPGRLERVKKSSIFVDYAHKPDALENVLATLREIAPARILTVFGCGGDRDKGKRPLMGAISEKYADFTIVTSDNPALKILFPYAVKLQEASKRKNISLNPIDEKRSPAPLRWRIGEDLILIAGKGHEKVQLFAHSFIPFDDCQVAEELLKRR